MSKYNIKIAFKGQESSFKINASSFTEAETILRNQLEVVSIAECKCNKKCKLC